MTHKSSSSAYKAEAALLACLFFIGVAAIWLGDQPNPSIDQNVMHGDNERNKTEVTSLPDVEVVDPSQALAPAVTMAQPSEKTSASVLKNYGQLPMYFEPNQGQVNSKEVRFTSHGGGYNLFLTPTQAVLALPQATSKRNDRAKDRKLKEISSTPLPGKQRRLTFVRMQLVDSNREAIATGGDELEGKSNYFIGNDPSKWLTDVPNYKEARFEGVYHGIDLEYYGNQSQLEYDFVVSPGADPNKIKMQFKGVKQITVGESGELILKTSGGEIRQHKPIIYQEQEDGTRQEVTGGYEIQGKEVSFWLSDYDRSKALIIDPVLVYSTFLGGSASESGFGIAVDSAGNAYVTGGTMSSDFPLQTPMQGYVGNAGNSDVFVTKLNAAGTALAYSTYLGGTSSDFGFSIALDAAGNAYTTGITFSTDFPLQGARQGIPGGSADGFVTKLNSTGSALVYSTYHGGNDYDFPSSIAVDSSGNAYVTGQTYSANFPLQGARQGAYAGNVDAFVTKFNSTGSALVYSTYHGGTSYDRGGGIAVDSGGNAYVTGETDSTDFPTQSARQPSLLGTADAFVTKFNSIGAFVYSTYHGGSDYEAGYSIAVDPSGNAYVTGLTASSNFPVQGARQATNGGGNDAFVTKFNPTASALVYSTYHGGNSGEAGRAIAVDSSGNAFVTGETYSTNFPLQNPRQLFNNGSPDLFVTKFNSTGNAFIYSTYHGGNASENVNGIALDSAGNAYVIGSTSSSNFPLSNPFQPTTDTVDSFVFKIADTATFSVTGKITTSAGLPVNGMNIQITGRESFSALTNSTGDYQLTLIPNGNYTIAPQLLNHTYSPTNYTFTPITANQTGKNFTATVANDNFANAFAIGNATTITGTNIAGTRETGEPNHAGQVGARSVWYKWTAPASGRYEFSIPAATSFSNPLLGIYTGPSVGSLVPVTAEAGRTNSFLRFTATAGVEYRIAVDGLAGANGSFQLSRRVPISSVSGAITNVNGDPLGPVTVTATCDTSIFQQSNATGSYVINLSPGQFDCNVTASGLGGGWTTAHNGGEIHIFSPTYKVSGVLNISGLNSINGLYVGFYGDNVGYVNCLPIALISTGHVSYECNGLVHQGNYSVQPGMANATFEPGSRFYGNITANQQNENYTGTISCAVTLTPDSQTFSAGGGAGGPVSVTVPGGCDWNAITSDSPPIPRPESNAGGAVLRNDPVSQAVDILAPKTNLSSITSGQPDTFSNARSESDVATTVGFTEGFEVVSPLPAGWVVQNNSSPAGTTNWFQGTSYFGAQSGAGYIAADYQNTTGANTISDWLITPNITFNNGDRIKFYTRTAAGFTFPDRLQVRLSTNGTSTNVGSTAEGTGDFSSLLLDINPTLSDGGYPETFTQFTVTISGLAGPTSGRIGFRYYVTNGGPSGANSLYIGIDTFSYEPASTWITNLAQGANSFSYNVAPLTGSTPRTGYVIVTTSTDSATFTVTQNPQTSPFASVSGKVLTPDSRGLRNASVRLTNPNDPLFVPRTVTTSSFGVYSFENVPTGASYTLSVVSKLYRFASRQISVNSNRANENFVGQE